MITLEFVWDEENEVLIAQSNVVPYRHYIIEDGAWWHLRITQALGLVPNQGKPITCYELAEAKQLANDYEQARLDGVGADEI